MSRPVEPPPLDGTPAGGMWLGGSEESGPPNTAAQLQADGFDFEAEVADVRKVAATQWKIVLSGHVPSSDQDAALLLTAALTDLWASALRWRSVDGAGSLIRVEREFTDDGR